MNGTRVLLDTNIVLYLLGGNPTVTDILDGTYPYLSFISQLELLGYQGITSEEQKHIRKFLEECIIVDINESIKVRTIEMKQKHSIKLPDSIIAATSQFLGIPLLTADKGFLKIRGLNVVMYEE